MDIESKLTTFEVNQARFVEQLISFASTIERIEKSRNEESRHNTKLIDNLTETVVELSSTISELRESLNLSISEVRNRVSRYIIGIWAAVLVSGITLPYFVHSKLVLLDNISPQIIQIETKVDYLMEFINAKN